MNKHHAWLHQELSRWLEEGLMDEQLALTLRQRYKLDRNWGRFVLSGIGAVLFGLGVILMFAYNWEAMHKFTKLGVIFTALIAAHGAAIWLRRSAGGVGFNSESLHLLGSMLFGAGIWLIAQIYHIEEHFPNAFFVWSMGALLLAWALPSLMQALLACVLILMWQMFESFSFENALHSALGLLLLGIFPLVWRLRSVVLASFASLALFASLMVNLFEFDQAVGLVLLLTAASGIALSRLLALRSLLPLAEIASGFRIPALMVYLLLLYLLTFPDIADELLLYALHWQHSHEVALAYLVAAALLALLLWGVVLFELFSRGLWREQVSDIAVASGAGLALLIAIIGVRGDWLIAIPFNLLFLFHAILLIIEGGRRLRLKLVVSGSLLLCFLAGARYIDLFESLLSRALVFFLVGAALFAVAHFYSRNKQAVADPL